MAGHMSKILVTFKKDWKRWQYSWKLGDSWCCKTHNAGLKAVNKILDATEKSSVSTDDLVKMTRFVLENNYFEFNGDVIKLTSETVSHLTVIYFWMNLKPNLYNPNHCNLWYGLDTSTIFSLFELMAKKNLKSS